MSQTQLPNQGNYPYPPYYGRQKRRSNWWIVLLVIGIILVIGFGIFATIIGVIGSAFEKEQVDVKDNSVLVIRLSNNPEYTPSNPFSMFSGIKQQVDFIELLTSVRRAKDDPKIKGILYLIKGESGLSGAKAEEFQKILEEFKSSGKFIYTYIETGTERNYYNALPSDKIFMLQEGLLEMNGFGATSLFFKNALDKIGVDVYVQQYEDFKSAAENLSRTKFSDSARYQLKVLLDQINDDFINQVVKYRKISKEKVLEALSNGLYTAEELQKYGFIDGIAFEEEVKNIIKKKVFGEKSDDKKLNLININRYAASEEEVPKEKMAEINKQIAIIYAVGAINHQPEEGWSNEASVRSSEFVRYLKKARENKKVKAIIIRIDSPGGSVIASDEIYDEIIKTRKVKPVYASMGNVAASGGYYIAMACDTIFAQPQTITGSVGVIFMLTNFNKLVGKLDISVDTISTSPASQFLSPFLPMSNQDKVHLESLSRNVYHRFVSKAAERRKKTFDEMRSLAKGRVWSGKDALERGLVDVEGGLLSAIDYAKKRIGVEANKKVLLDIYPRPQDELTSILKIFGIEKQEDQTVNLKSLSRELKISYQDLISMWSVLPEQFRKELIYNYQLIEMSKNEKVLMAMPENFEIK
ncbi:MAG: signal peptide peptidase SppA [Ignavibacteria bacterium]|nr:signal peptide peptidase SppA [Ignavibacteria bacterium]